MRLIDAEDLHTHKFLTPQVKVIGGRRNGKIREQIIEAYQKGWNDCIDAIVDNAPTVDTGDTKYLEERDADAWESGYIQGLSDKPQGEWEEPFENNGKTYHKCNRCHISSELILIDRFCPSCGADMRKGGAE